MIEFSVRCSKNDQVPSEGESGKGSGSAIDVGRISFNGLLAGSQIWSQVRFDEVH